MISIEDCIAMCGLDDREVAAISEHEQIPDIAAAALAKNLLNRPRGGVLIRQMIVEDIQWALDGGRMKHASELFLALNHFLESYPDARAGLRAN